MKDSFQSLQLSNDSASLTILPPKITMQLTMMETLDDT